MNTVIRLTTGVLLILLIIFAYTGPGGIDTRVKRTGPRGARLSDAPLPGRQTVVEPDAEPATSATEEAKAVVRPIAHSSWIKNGAYEVFGEVQNVGPITGRQIKAQVIFRDLNWKTQLGVVERAVDNPTLAPGQRSSFRVRFPGDAKKVGSYVLLVYVQPKNPVPAQGLDEIVQARVRGRKSAGTTGGDVFAAPGSEYSPLPLPFLLGVLLLWGAHRYGQWRMA